jgi:hypothetical protein
VFAAAWLVPVHKEGTSLPEGVPGWQAFRMAAAPVWPYEGVSYETWWGATLATVSAGTNLVMIGSLFLALQRRSLVRMTAIASLAAFVVNAQWLFLNTDWVDLRAGYYLWWLSFLAISVASLRSAAMTPAGYTQDAAA